MLLTTEPSISTILYCKGLRNAEEGPKHEEYAKTSRQQLYQCSFDRLRFWFLSMASPLDEGKLVYTTLGPIGQANQRGKDSFPWELIV